MRLAISNIAWPAGADSEAAALMHAHAIEGVELALTKIWPEPATAAADEVRAYRERWEKKGIRIAALQALLFGKPQLTVFGAEANRQQTLEYLGAIIERAAWLGACALVFGSPKNRQRGERSAAETWAIAVPFFRELGRIAARHGVYFCIEPNPRDYGCNFVTTAAEGIELVDAVAEKGFGLHLDTGGMTLAGEPPTSTITDALERCRHFHVSEPFLAEVGSGTRVNHAECAQALRARHYPGWVSIEMGEPKGDGNWRAAMENALLFVRKTYTEGGTHAAA